MQEPDDNMYIDLIVIKNQNKLIDKKKREKIF